MGPSDHALNVLLQEYVKRLITFSSVYSHHRKWSVGDIYVVYKFNAKFSNSAKNQNLVRVGQLNVIRIKLSILWNTGRTP